MPLNWLFSTMMILVIMMSAMMIYSEKMIDSKIDYKFSHKKNNMMMWLW